MDDLISKFNTSQNILSSIGEHWSEATRARDCVKELSTMTIQRLLKTQPAQSESHYQVTDNQRLAPGRSQHQYQVDRSHGEVTAEGPVHVLTDMWPTGNAQASFEAPASEFSSLFDDFLQGDFPGWSGMSDIDGLMWDIFNNGPQ